MHISLTPLVLTLLVAVTCVLSDVHQSRQCTSQNQPGQPYSSSGLSLLQTHDIKATSVLIKEDELQQHSPDYLQVGDTMQMKPVAELPKNSFNFWGYDVYKVAETGFYENNASESPAIDPPSTEPRQLAQLGKSTYSQWKQDLILMPILERIGAGFFVESGAKDGESDSNTLLYELQKGWSGLLVEPNPDAFQKMKLKHRHSYAYNGCISPSGRKETLHFRPGPAPDGSLGHIAENSGFTVQGASLQDLLSSIGQSSVDFWSLDIEGSESTVLHTTNFSQVEIGVLLIEMNKNSANNNGIHEIMQREGFHDIGHTFDGELMTLDQIFVNPEYFKKRQLTVPSGQDLEPMYRN